MKFVYSIIHTSTGEKVIDNLLLEHALSIWKIQGYEHTEYQIVMHPDLRDLQQTKTLDLIYIDISDEYQPRRPTDFEIRCFYHEEHYGPDIKLDS